MPASHPKSSIPVTSSSLDDDSTTMGNGVPNNPPAGGYISSSSNAANTDNNSHTNGGDGNSIVERYMDQTNHIMDRLFSSCADDPKGSVHRAWGISLIFVVVFFIISIFEMWNLHSSGSAALVVAAVVIGLCHLILGILGTFVLKRFPTSFSVGFLLGIVIILANQNLIFFGTFYRYDYGTMNTNHIFGLLGFVLALILFLFGILLYHFRNDIVVAPADALMASSSSMKRSNHPTTTTLSPTNSTSAIGSNYVQYGEEEEGVRA